jgi:hypothetical protein
MYRSNLVLIRNECNLENQKYCTRGFHHTSDTEERIAEMSDRDMKKIIADLKRPGASHSKLECC